MSGSNGSNGARRGDGEAGVPGHLAGRRAGRPRAGRDRRSLAVRIAAIGVLAPALAGAALVDGWRNGSPAPPAGRPAPLMPAAGDGRPSTWYCAAGTAEDGGFADHTVGIVNHGAAAVTADLTVVTGAVAPDAAPGGEPPAAERRVAVPAGGRAEVRLGDLVDAPLAAAVVEVGAGDVVVEHLVGGEHGEDAGPCSPFAAATWHVGWAATTRDARAVVAVLNPFPSPATVDAVLATEDGRREPVRLQGVPVPGRTVVGIDLGLDVTRSEQVSATLRARSGRIVVERVQQYDGTLGLRGLAVDLGAPSPALAWAFPDGEATAPASRTPPPGAGGDTGDDGEGEGPADGGAPRSTERIVVYNPGRERAAEVEVRVLPAAGAPGGPTARSPLPFHLSVRPGGYEVVDYGEHDRVEPGVPHATVVRSTNGQPVVAERVTAGVEPTRDRGGDGDGDATGAGADGLPPPALTAGPGAAFAAARWWLPGLSPAGEPDGGAAAAVVLNPGSAPVEVRLVRSAGDRPAPPVRLAPGARAEVGLDGGPSAALGVVADGPVVVERVVRAADGRRVGTGPAVPLAATAAPLDAVVAGGPLAAPPA